MFWSNSGTHMGYKWDTSHNYPNLLKFLRGKSGTLENLVGCVLLAYLLAVHPVKYLPMISHLGNMSQMPHTDFFNIYFYIFYCINGVVFSPGSLRFLG